MKKPKALHNKAGNVETPSEREKLVNELGELTYKLAICNTKMAKLQKQREPILERSNQIANELEGMSNGKNI